MREVDGLRIAFVEHDAYFDGFGSASMASTAKATGADITLLLAEGKRAEDITDDSIRDMLRWMGRK